jgi:hypothetical protein
MADSDSMSVSDAEVKRRRKGVVNKDEYKREKIKKAKLKGLQHINHKGRNVPAKKQGDDCK